MENSSYYDAQNKITLSISQILDVNIRNIEEIFFEWGDIVKKKFLLKRKNGYVGIYIVYVDGLTDNEMIERTIIRPLLFEWKENTDENVFASIRDKQIETTDIDEEAEFDAVVLGILRGDGAIFVDGYDKVLLISSKNLPLRGISTPEKESGMKGGLDSFNESMRMGTALIRRRIRDPKLKAKQDYLGQRSRTDYALMYMEDLIYPSMLKEIESRLKNFEIDGIYDSNTLLQLLEDKWYSPFPQFQTTERPDKAASAILEGRIVMVVDNSPEVVILPATLNTFFQAADDYYNRFAVGTFARWIRYLCAYISILLPGLYIAITCFHQEVLPTKLLLAIMGARTNITFPIIIEVLVMEFLFELLREAGIRLPGKMGNTIGVVGGLIVGQAAVEASLVSTIVVIVVALTAISSFAIPNEEFVSTFRLLKFFLIFAGAIWGLYGIIMAVLVILIHLSDLTSLGIPYMMPAVSGSVNANQDQKDFFMRFPVFSMKKRPVFTKENNRKRFKQKII